MTDAVWKETAVLTLPYGTLATLHHGASKVCVRENLYTQEKRVFKRISLLGREDTLAVSEANILLGIDHPNIARVFDVAEPTGHDPALSLVEIVMPYYEMGSAFDAIQGRHERLTPATARDLVVKALRGIGHLHEARRILHRDIKPANLFLCGDRSLVKVGDFGEAMPMDAQGTAPSLLSPQYWSAPECFTGARYSVASELYSVGMTFAELLSGPFPYDGYTREQLGERLAAGRCALLPRHLRPAAHVPASLRRIVSKATRPDPASRFGTADEMLQALLAARFVDWCWPQVSDDALEWSGSDWRGIEYRVTSQRRRSSGWRARGMRRYASGWRRLPQVDDVDSAAPEAAAAAIFAAIDRLL